MTKFVFSINSENELNLIRLGVVHLRHLLCDILRTRKSLKSFSVIVTVNIVQLFNIISKPMFLPRDAMHKRGLCRHAVSVRPSVCVSVTFVDHVKTNKDIFEIFSPPGSHAILVFPRQTA